MITIKQSKGMDLLNRLIKFVVVFYIKIRMSFEILSLYAKRFNGVYVYSIFGSLCGGIQIVVCWFDKVIKVMLLSLIPSFLFNIILKLANISS